MDRFMLLFQSLLDNPRKLLLTLCSLTLALLFLWASQTSMQDVVRGQGRVVPQAKTQKVQHLEGGIVQEILVREGQVVKKDAPLFRINAITANAEVEDTQLRSVALQARQERLQAEQSGTALEFSPGLSSLDRAASILSAEQEVFQSRKREFDRELSVADEQVQQRRLSIVKLESELSSTQKELDIAKRQLEINTRLHAKGALSEAQLLNAQAGVSSLEGRMVNTQTQIPVVQAELKELRHRSQQINDERQSKISSELSEVGLQLEQLGEKRKTLDDRLSRTSVVAPMDGIINQLYVTTAEGVIQPGQVLAELTPTSGDVLVEGRVRARDRGKIWLGQAALVRVSAFDYTHYGALAGKVEDISADSFVDEHNPTAPFYRVKIRLKSNAFANAKEGEATVLPGMTVDFHIQAGSRTILQTLLAPLLEEMWISFAPKPAL